MKILKPNEYVNIQKFKICLLLCSLTLLLSNCKKENIQLNQSQPKVVDLSKVYKLPSTPSEINLVNNLDFNKIYRDNKLDIIDLLHMDIQGSELSLIKDLIEYINNRKILNIVIATHSHQMNQCYQME